MVIPRKGKLVVLESLDGAGKTTQIDLLLKKFPSSHIFKYPTKRNPKLKNYLEGKIEMDEKELFHLFLDDIKEEQEKVKKALYSGGCFGCFVILDRYVFSTIAYGKKGISFEKAKEEVKKSNVLEPDLVILLDLNPKSSYERKKKQKKPDRYESNITYLKKVRANFLKLYKEKFLCKKWIKIDATKSIDEIHRDVLRHLQ